MSDGVGKSTLASAMNVISDGNHDKVSILVAKLGWIYVYTSYLLNLIHKHSYHIQYLLKADDIF